MKDETRGRRNRPRARRGLVPLAVGAAIMVAPASAFAAGAAIPLTAFPVPTANSGVAGIAAAPDGSVWFTETTAGKVGCIQPNGSIADEAAPTPHSAPGGIAVAPDGTVWFTETSADKIGEVSPSGTTCGTITEYPIPGSNAPGQITIGPDGNPWFTEPAANKIGTLALSDGVASFSQYSIPAAGDEPEGITAGSGSNLIFTESPTSATESLEPSGLNQQLDEITTTGSFAAPNALPNLGIGPGAIVTDPDGNPWFLEPNDPPDVAPGLETLDSEWFTHETSSPNGIASGADGSLWFNAPGNGTIGWLSTTNALTEIYGVGPSASVSSLGGPNTMVAGANDTIWFTEPGANAIESVAVTPPAITAPASLSLTTGVPVDITVTSTGWPVPELTETGLPDGLTFQDNGDGTATIYGAPSIASSGDTGSLVITATSSFATSAQQTIPFSVAVNHSGGTPPATSPPPPPPPPPPTTTTTTTPTTPMTTSTTPTSTSAPVKPTKARVTHVRVSGSTVRVTVTCSGTSGQHCSISAKLSFSGTKVTMRDKLAAGQSHTFAFKPSAKVASRLAHARTPTKATLTVSQSVSSGAHAVLRRTVKL